MGEHDEVGDVEVCVKGNRYFGGRVGSGLGRFRTGIFGGRIGSRGWGPISPVIWICTL